MKDKGQAVLDTLDVLIFCEMSFKYFDYSGRQRRSNPKEIGAKLGIDERTVRLRTRKMEKEGFIQYYQLFPNLRLFNQPVASLCNFEAPQLSMKPRILESLRSAEDIIDIADFLGESLGVTISASSEIESTKKAEILAEKLGLTGFHLLSARQFPPVEKQLNGIDWQVVRALRYDAQRPTGTIAKELGITYRMADYTIRRLFETRSVSNRAIINARDPKGVIFYSINLMINEKEGERVKREIRLSFGKRVWWTVSPPGPAIVLFLFATSIGRAEDDLLEALSRPGVKSGSLTIFKGWVEPTKPSWIDRAIDQKISANRKV